MDAALKSRTMAVTAVLVAWDPLSVIRGATAGDDTIDGIRDEYDDLALPLLGRLQRGESSAELAARSFLKVVSRARAVRNFTEGVVVCFGRPGTVQ